MSQTLEAIPTREFPCPRCKQPARWAENAFRPFCSERCKMIDLGAWANEDYRVPEHDHPGQTSDETNDFAEE
jgi:endogenous inhibitor of DNA gyrase (YacG/DUF329 family)